MSPIGKELVESLGEALAHAKGEGPAIVHTPVTPREVGMSLSGYRKWEQGARPASCMNPRRDV